MNINEADDSKIMQQSKHKTCHIMSNIFGLKDIKKACYGDKIGALKFLLNLSTLLQLDWNIKFLIVNNTFILFTVERVYFE